MEKEHREHDRREALMARRVNLELEIGDYSYSKPNTQCLYMPEKFNLSTIKQEPAPIISNPISWIKTLSPLLLDNL